MNVMLALWGKLFSIIAAGLAAIFLALTGQFIASGIFFLAFLYADKRFDEVAELLKNNEGRKK